MKRARVQVTFPIRHAKKICEESTPRLTENDSPTPTSQIRKIVWHCVETPAPIAAAAALFARRAAPARERRAGLCRAWPKTRRGRDGNPRYFFERPTRNNKKRNAATVRDRLRPLRRTRRSRLFRARRLNPHRSFDSKLRSTREESREEPQILRFLLRIFHNNALSSRKGHTQEVSQTPVHSRTTDIQKGYSKKDSKAIPACAAPPAPPAESRLCQEYQSFKAIATPGNVSKRHREKAKVRHVSKSHV